MATGQKIDAGMFLANKLDDQGADVSTIRSATDQYVGDLGLDAGSISDTTMLWPLLGNTGYSFTYDSGGEPEWKAALQRACDQGRRVHVIFEVV